MSRMNPIANSRGWIAAGIALLAVFQPLIPALADESAPRLEIESGTASAFAGWYWGVGDVIVDGVRTPIRLEGPTIGQVGGAHGAAVGRIQNLKRLEDLAGHYVAAEAGATFARGGRAVAMRNTKGVVITLISEDEGLLMGLGGRALRLRFEGTRAPSPMAGTDRTARAAHGD